MIGLEKVLKNKDKITLVQCEELAKEIGYNKALFDLTTSTGTHSCKWIDAYYGLFTIVDQDFQGFMKVHDFIYEDNIYCTNIRLEEK